MKTLAVAAALVAAPCLADPALAMQTEVRPGVMEWKRSALARWNRSVELEAARAIMNVGGTTKPGRQAPSSGGGSASPSHLSASQVAAYARAAGFPESVIPTMVAIAARESGFDPAAVNPSSGACGLWQLYPCPGPEALNPATNAAMAYAKYAASGLAPWGYG